MPDLDIEKYLKINELMLADELAMCASYYYTFASLEVEAEDAYEHATMALEIYEAELSAKFRSDAALKLAKATQKQVESFYKADEKWQLLKREQLKLQRNYRLMHKGASALEMKSRMLMSINRRDLFSRDKGFGNKRGEDD